MFKAHWATHSMVPAYAHGLTSHLLIRFHAHATKQTSTCMWHGKAQRLTHPCRFELVAEEGPCWVSVTSYSVCNY